MITEFYDQLAPYYHYVYADWEASVKRQAAALDGIIHEFFDPTERTLLDAACGIGTQSLGLAELGYAVTASDISPAAIERARVEATRRNLTIDFQLADMRAPRAATRVPFDMVIACDNAVPHLLTDADILQAFQQFYAGTTPHGGCIISVRDYANIQLGGRQVFQRTVHDIPGGRLFQFDVWDFDGDYYDLTIYFVEDRGQAEATTHVARGGRYYCVTLDKLAHLLKDAGFQRAVTIRERFFQPVLVALKQDSRMAL